MLAHGSLSSPEGLEDGFSKVCTHCIANAAIDQLIDIQGAALTNKLTFKEFPHCHRKTRLYINLTNRASKLDIFLTFNNLPVIFKKIMLIIGNLHIF